MTAAEKLELAFYKNGSAESVLKRFVFSETEEKLVRDAMRTAQLANPRMKLIRDADELLREVAKTREPLEPTEKTKLSPEAMMNINMVSFKHTPTEKDSKRIPFFYLPKTKSGRVIYFGMIAIIILLQFTAIDNAQEVQNEATQSAQKIAEEQMNLIRGIK